MQFNSFKNVNVMDFKHNVGNTQLFCSGQQYYPVLSWLVVLLVLSDFILKLISQSCIDAEVNVQEEKNLFEMFPNIVQSSNLTHETKFPKVVTLSPFNYIFSF